MVTFHSRFIAQNTTRHTAVTSRHEFPTSEGLTNTHETMPRLKAQHGDRQRRQHDGAHTDTHA